ncbi:MAG: recombination mediator RecR [Campylobacterales bacterium]
MNRDLQNFNDLVEIFNSLPGLGKKSALRLAHHITVDDKFKGARMAHVIEKAVTSVKVCDECGGITEHEICDICSDGSRDGSKLCIVESAKDISFLESIKSYNGYYFVLQNDVQLEIEKIKSIAKDRDVKEIIFAFAPSIASDGLIIYIEDSLSMLEIEFTKIAQGIPGGISLENIDIFSLSRAMEKRVKI